MKTGKGTRAERPGEETEDVFSLRVEGLSRERRWRSSSEKGWRRITIANTEGYIKKREENGKTIISLDYRVPFMDRV